jgi:iron complex transport system ATP-binding protein
MSAAVPAAAGVHLSLRNLAVSYDGSPALSGVSAEVPAGGWTALIGPNGAGKSTLLRVVAGLVPHAGDVLLDGVPIDRRHPRRLARRIALVPQRPTLPAQMTVGDYVLLGRTAHLPLLGAETARDRAAAAEALDRLDLAPFAGRPLGSLSGGEAQRATLARAVAQQAPVLLLDEPTSSLDVGHVQQVLELVDELRDERGLTVLSAMHDLTLAGQYAAELLLLDRGRAVAHGPAPSVLRAELLEARYGARLAVLPCPDGPAVVPVRPTTVAHGGSPWR